MTDVDGDKSPLQERTPQAEGDGKDTLDSRFGSFGIGTASPDKYCYNFNYPKRGVFVIINNKNFEASTGMGPRSGTDMDKANLYQRFKELGFEVRPYDNLRKAEMLKVMSSVAAEDHSNNDCFGCAILSHGDEGVVYGRDGQIELDRLIDPFKGPRCASLLGKPKMFIIQACRGTELDHGVEVFKSDADSPMDAEQVYRIPTEADFIYAYSTVAGYFSWRNSTRGSWFIQALCKMLKDYGRTMDLCRIITRVHHEVAYEFESNASKESMNKKKQIPSMVSMLTKDIIFNKK